MLRRRIIRRFFQLLPWGIQLYLIRKFIKLNFAPSPDGLTFSIAKNWEEVKETLEIAYQGLREIGFTKENPHKLYISQFQLLPATRIVAIKFKGKIIGTFTFIPDGKFGLPSDRLINLDFIRKSGSLVEGGTLSVLPEFRHLTKYIWPRIGVFFYRHLILPGKFKNAVIRANPAHSIFYQAFFGFSPLFTKAKPDLLANGAPLCVVHYSYPHSDSFLQNCFGERDGRVITCFEFASKTAIPEYLFDNIDDEPNYLDELELWFRKINAELTREQEEIILYSKQIRN